MECLELFEIRSMGVGAEPHRTPGSSKWQQLQVTPHILFKAHIYDKLDGWLVGFGPIGSYCWQLTTLEFLCSVCFFLFCWFFLPSSSHVYAWFNEDGYCAMCVWEILGDLPGKTASNPPNHLEIHIWDVGRSQTRRWMPASSRYFMIVYYEHLI